MKRKTPVRHKVSSYTKKNGTHISQYNRGKGSKTSTTKKKVVGKDDIVTLMEPKAFTINFKYSNKPDDGESVIVLVGEKGTPMGEAYELA